jgi:proteasome lid subunit RPN8/RPN11
MVIERQIIDKLIEHARKDAPLEACGYLAEKDGIVSMHFPLTNIDASAEHFSLGPSEQFSAIRKIRDLGLKMYAVYHSHPQSPARPSVEDIRLAYDPEIHYVIVSLQNDTATVASFKIKNGTVTEENIEII